MKVLSFLERLLTVLFWVLIIFGFDLPYLAVLTLICAFIHEIGHMLALPRHFPCERGLPHGTVSGLRIRTASLSYGMELRMALGGPIANIVLFLILMPFAEGEPYIYAFGLLNLATALSNLLPIIGYDGYRALFCTACILGKDPERCERVLSLISFILSAFLALLSLYMLWRIGEGFWFCAVSLGFTLSQLFSRIREDL